MITTSSLNTYKTQKIKKNFDTEIREFSSDGPYDYLPGPSVKVVQPNGGENFWGYQTIQIKWNRKFEELLPIVDISLIYGNSEIELFERTENDGLQMWRIPNNITSDECKIKIKGMFDGYEIVDETDTNFSIKSRYISIENSRQREIVANKSNIHTVRWTDRGTSRFYKIEIINSKNNKVFSILENRYYISPEEELAYDWTVDNIPPYILDKCKIKISDAEVPEVFSISYEIDLIVPDVKFSSLGVDIYDPEINMVKDIGGTFDPSIILLNKDFAETKIIDPIVNPPPPVGSPSGLLTINRTAAKANDTVELNWNLYDIKNTNSIKDIAEIEFKYEDNNGNESNIKSDIIYDDSLNRTSGNITYRIPSSIDRKNINAINTIIFILKIKRNSKIVYSERRECGVINIVTPDPVTTIESFGFNTNSVIEGQNIVASWSTENASNVDLYIWSGTTNTWTKYNVANNGSKTINVKKKQNFYKDIVDISTTPTIRNQHTVVNLDGNEEIIINDKSDPSVRYYVKCKLVASGVKSVERIIEAQIKDPAPIVDMYELTINPVNPNPVSVGNNFLVSWTSRNVETLSIDGINVTPKMVSLNGNISIKANSIGTNTYTFIGTSTGGQKFEKKIKVDVIRKDPKPEIKKFFLSDVQINENESTLLNWEVSNARYVYINGVTASGPKGTMSVSGKITSKDEEAIVYDDKSSRTGQPTGEAILKGKLNVDDMREGTFRIKQYILKATNVDYDDATNSESVTDIEKLYVKLIPPISYKINMNANPVKVSKGGRVTLSWSSNLENGLILTANGTPLGNTDEAIQVQKPANANKRNVDKNVDKNGTFYVYPEKNTTYTLSGIANDGNSYKNSVGITVQETKKLDIYPEIDVTSRNQLLNIGGSTTIEWITKNAVSVYFVNESDTVARRGSITVKPIKNTVYKFRAESETGHIKEGSIEIKIKVTDRDPETGGGGSKDRNTDRDPESNQNGNVSGDTSKDVEESGIASGDTKRTDRETYEGDLKSTSVTDNTKKLKEPKQL